MRLPRPLIRAVLTFLQGPRRLLWLATGMGLDGVHAVPVTPDGKVVLVRLTYARGWRMPGGGRKRGETQEEGMLRELREEIGLVRHGAVERLDFLPNKARRGDRSALFAVRDVAYRPRQTLEVEEVGEFDPARLPAGVVDTTRETIEALGLARKAGG